MTIAELQNLLQPEIQDLLALYHSDDPAAFAMQHNGCRELPVRAPKNILITPHCVCILAKYVEIRPITIMAGG